MELSQDISKGLELLGDPKQIPDNCFSEITQLAFGIILDRASEDHIAKSQVLSKQDRITIKQTLSALVSFILEGAKLNCDPLLLQGALEEVKFEKGRIQQITKIYSETKSNIRAALNTTTFAFPHIVDVDWRLDYYIKSNTIEKVNSPTYFISLKTNQPQKPGKPETEGKVEFTCTMEQLQDLVTKLKDATKQVERSATS